MISFHVLIDSYTIPPSLAAGQYCKCPACILLPPGSVAAQGWLGRSSPGESWGLRKSEPSFPWELCLNGGCPTGPCSSYSLRCTPSSVCAQPLPWPWAAVPTWPQHGPWSCLMPGLGDCPLASLASNVTDMETALCSQSCTWPFQKTADSIWQDSIRNLQCWYPYSVLYNQTTREFTALGFCNDAHQKYHMLFTAI